MSSPAAAADYPIQPVPFTAVKLSDAFWSPRIETNRSVTIPFAFEKCEESGRMHNFERAATALRGETVADNTPSGFPFDDTDPYKVIEGASFTLSVHPDPALEAYIDTLIEKIAAAQEPDGYLFTARTIDPEHPHSWVGRERWEKEEQGSHELYNLGHLYEAAAAHYEATGKRSLLEIALRTVEMLDRTFGPGKRAIWPGHQIIEMGLARLYRITGDTRYLDLARFFLDCRGGSGEYAQAHKPVTEQTTAVGHAVRATYMYAGMADIAALTGDPSYIRAVDTIWQDVADHHLYITGGIGSTSKGEAFGPAYDLPNATAYCETCAAIGNVYWNHRLFLLHGDAKYIDVLERSLYNGLLSGVSLDGKAFFYPNPLASTGNYERSPWFGCACCPGNMTRFLASVPGYQYARRGSDLYVNLYAGGTAAVPLSEISSVTLTQATRYPWDGEIRLTVTPDKTASTFALLLRIPGWAHNEPLASDLYRFHDTSDAVPILTANGEPIAMTLENGYARIEREWQAGDTVALILPMPIRRVIASEKVEADRGRVALQRGPLVYCMEGADFPGISVQDVCLPDDAPLTAQFRPDLLNGVMAITGQAHLVSEVDGDVQWGPLDVTAIPYYAWSNRGKNAMQVWVARDEKTVLSSRNEGAPVVGGH